ncbi:MAG: peptidoglycan editing factor PgeF [Candidatus Cloacimonetes bacterium]|nr:peptidoglycan editing factor PgeF [Candidatus Cloacimonadota bacterium]
MNWQENFNSPNIIARFGDIHSDTAQLADLCKNYTCFELEQTHSSQLMVIRCADDYDILPEADAMLTAQPDIALIIRTADCYPILFFDPVKKIIAAAHSGREGTRKNIAQAVINKMTCSGSFPENILAAIGPGISTKAYQVDADTWEKFCQSTGTIHNFPFLDIRRTITTQLQNAGIPAVNIFHHDHCTFSNKNYYSYRRNKTRKRQYNWIILK